MPSLPADRTKLALAQGNQVPSVVIASAKNINAITEAYDTIDALYNYALSLVTSGTLSPVPPDFMQRQAIINGNFDVWQRGTSFTGSGLYTADRWRQHHDHTSVSTSMQAAFTPTGSGNVLRMENITKGAGTFYILTQHIETNNCIPFIGRTCTLSLKLRKNSSLISGNLVVSINVTTNIDDGNAYNGASVASTSIDLSSLTTSFQQFSITANIGDTIRTIAIKLQMQSPTDGGYIEVSQVQLCEGNTALPFQSKSFEDELRACQRYYEKSYDYGTSPASATTLNGLIYKVVPSNTVATLQNYGHNPFKVQKRVVPTVTVYPYTTPSNTGRISDGTGTDLGADSGAVNISGSSGFSLFNSSGGTLTTTGNAVTFHYAADSEL